MIEYIKTTGVDYSSKEYIELAQLLTTMCVPQARITDIRWLCRNIQIQNGTHPNIQQVMVLIKNILQSSYNKV